MPLIEWIRDRVTGQDIEHPASPHERRPAGCFRDESSQGAFLRSFDGRVIPLRKSSLRRNRR